VDVEPVELLEAEVPELLPQPTEKPSIATRTKQLSRDQAFLDRLNPNNSAPARAAAPSGMDFRSGRLFSEDAMWVAPFLTNVCAAGSVLHALSEV
jgi:hypothetical protein